MERVWKCLDSCYGFLEKVEVVFKKKLNFVFKMIVKDRGEMYEFFDILFEIRVVKERLEYVGFLSFYDIFMGINFMVIKLLFNL